jgi:hypothetical protein
LAGQTGDPDIQACPGLSHPETDGSPIFDIPKKPKPLVKMKRIYPVFLCAVAALGVTAQNLPSHRAHKFSMAASHPVPMAQQDRGAAIWTNDFSDPSTWLMGGDGDDDWVIGTAGPSGAYAIDPIESTTADNGFALFDSDLYCSDNGDDAYIQNVNPINCSGFPLIVLQFEEFYRKFGDIPYVEVSNDGVNFTPFEVNSGVTTNQYCGPNPTLVTVPISAVAGNQSDVYIRFHYTSAAGCDYSWMVDDVSINAVVGNNMSMVDAGMTTWNSSTNATYDSLAYTIYPISELRPLGLHMRATNNGASAEHATADINTTDGYTASQDLGTMAMTDTATFYAPGYTPTATPGWYDINFSVTGDSVDTDPSDNQLTDSVGVTNYIFARDRGQLEQLWYDDASGSAYKIGNAYHIVADEQLYGIQVALYDSSTTGIELTAQLLDPNTANFDILAESEYHTLTQDELSGPGEANFINFTFNPPVDLTAGTDYVVALNHFGGALVMTGASGTSPAQSSFLYQSSDDTWYYVTSTPMVRMVLGNIIGIPENDMHNGVGLGQNNPNPANESTTVTFSLAAGSNISLNLYDINGKLVRNLAQGHMSIGNHNVLVNTSGLDEGVYFYTLTTDGAVSTKRMTVVH